MKKLLIIIAVMAVTAISGRSQSYPSASIGCQFRFSEGARASRVHASFDRQYAYVSWGINGYIPTSKYQIWGVDFHIGPSFKVAQYARVNTEFVFARDNGHWSPGLAVHARWLIIGPLGVFGRVQCTCPLEFDPFMAGQLFPSMTIGVFIQRYPRQYPAWGKKPKKR